MKAAFIVGGIFVIGIAVLLALYLRDKSLKSKKMGIKVEQYGFLHNALLTQFPVPYAVLADDGKILWANDKFVSIFEKEQAKERYLSSYIHELNRSIFPKEEENVVNLEVSYGDRDYKATLMYVSVKNLHALEGTFGFAKDREAVVTVSFEDITDLHWYMRENESQSISIIMKRSWKVWRKFDNHSLSRLLTER